MTERVVMFSGGVGSWAAARRVAERHGTDELTLLFADTRIEDEDLYRFLDEASADIGARLVKVADGRTPWDVFRDVRFLGNTRVDPCSRVLKRELCDRWLAENCDPERTRVYLGISWDEEHRFTRAKERLASLGWNARAPLCEEPLPPLGDGWAIRWLEQAGIEPPRLYRMGFPHNNCGGFCVKAGQAHFKLLLEKLPERYAHHERQEEELRAYLDKDIAILRDRRGGKTRPMTLQTLRERVESEQPIDEDEWGGCGCFSGGTE
ncbi:MAG TPA: hypothetical protein VIY27_09110 [Myxococcota bacterium]